MMRVLIGSMLCLTLAATTGCSRDRDGSSERPSVAEVARGGDRDHLEVTGCLSTNPQTQQYVLTANSNPLSSLANRSAAGEAETYHYQLVGGNDLASMVGKEVKVTGAIVGKGKDVDAKAETVEKEPKSSGSDATPVVETTEQVELQVEQLKVASVIPTGSECRVAR